MEGKIIAIKPVTLLLHHVIEMMPLLKDDLPVKWEYASQKLEACLSSTVLSHSEYFFEEKAELRQFDKIQLLCL